MGSKSSEEVGENIRLWFAPWRKIFTQEERSVCWSIFGGKAAVMFHIVKCQLPTHHQHDMFDESDDEVK